METVTPADMTFLTLDSQEVRDAEGNIVQLLLCRERSAGKHTFYALVNQIRVRPDEKKIANSALHSRAWFESLHRLYHEAAHRGHATYDPHTYRVLGC
jgi:hypothetical protein